MTTREQVRSAIRAALREAGGGDAAGAFAVEPPADPGHGDYATNAALVLAKSAGMNPRDTASAIAERLSNDRDLIAKVEVAGPGFINIWLPDAVLQKALGEVLTAPDAWGTSDIGKGKTVRVEYFQLNIAKRPHVGHLRSAVIGDAIKRMLLAQGYNAVSDTHVGDWGTQFGILLKGYKEFIAHGESIPPDADPFEFLERIYVNQFDHLEDIREQGKLEFAKLERGDPENRKIWEWMVDVSMRKLEQAAGRLSLIPFDMHRGESFYEDKMAPLVESALRKGVAKKTSDGAVVVDLAADGLDEAVLVKSDCASTYLLRDLATIRYMKETLDFAGNLYVVDVRQSHHFRQLFRVAELLGFEGVGESEHIEFGFMTSPEGALSTRKGTAISLDTVIDEARDRARKIIAEKNPDLGNADTVAEHVGLGALKYFDLSHHRRSDVVFRWEDALAFEGNTGPYLQYTHARFRSILRKLPTDHHNSSDRVNSGDAWNGASLDAAEHRLLVAILRLPEAIEDALKDYTPNTLANYLYGLAKLANEFYHSHPVLPEPDEAKRRLRIAVVAGVALTLKNGLNLLGIEAPQEM